MGLFRRRERAKDEGLRSTYPEEWLAGENLANYAFRDMVFGGMEPEGRVNRKDLEQAAREHADEAEDRFLLMRGASRSDVHPHARQAFRTGFARRFVGLIVAHGKTSARDEFGAVIEDVVGMINPGTVEALVFGAEAARQASDVVEGMYMMRSTAVDDLRARGVTGSMSVREMAERNRESVVKLLQAQVFLGLEPLDESYREFIGDEGWQRLVGANEARERRLRGGPLVPN